MPLHILHHKSWHPGNLPARERVLKDEAIRDANIAELKARATKAEAESRLLSLRRAAGFHLDIPPPPTSSTSSLPLPLDATSSSLSSGLPTATDRKSTSTSQANNLFGATVGQLPWYAKSKSLPPAAVSGGGGGGASGGGGQNNLVRDEKRKYLLDPLVKMRADRDTTSGGRSGLSLKRKRDTDSVIPLRAMPSTSLPLPLASTAIDWDKLRRERLAREAIEGARATRQLMNAAWDGEISKKNSDEGGGKPSASTVAFASVAASQAADVRAFDQKGRRW